MRCLYLVLPVLAGLTLALPNPSNSIVTEDESIHAGLLVSVTKGASNIGEPHVFKAKQIAIDNSRLLPVAERADHRQDLRLNVWPFLVDGWVDTSTLSIGVDVDVFGARIFNLSGSLRDGVVGQIDLLFAEGEIRFYLRNNTEIWAHLHLHVRFDGTIDQDVRLLTI